MKLSERLEQTRELARNMKGLPDGWGFSHLDLSCHLVPPVDRNDRHPGVSYRLDRPDHEHLAWTAAAYFGKVPFNPKGMRRIRVYLNADRPARCLERLNQSLRKGIKDPKRGIDWPPVRFHND